MSLNIAVFVPEGIVISSDTLSFVKNGDDGYFSVAERTFCLWNRYILSFAGNGYMDGLPYGYYVNAFLSEYHSHDVETTDCLMKLFSGFVMRCVPDNEEVIYCAGYDAEGTRQIPCLWLWDKGQMARLNYDERCSQPLYNYHTVGNSVWINKLLLPTTFEDLVVNRKEEFLAADIDFSKYSISTAVEFAHFLLDLTGTMDVVTQRRITVNKSFTTACVVPVKGAYIQRRDIQASFLF